MAERPVVRRIGAAVTSLAALVTATGLGWAQPRQAPADRTALRADVAMAPVASIGVSQPSSSSSSSDYTPVTEPVRGRVGDTVVVRLGVANLGPGTPDGESLGSFAVVPPPGTTITSIPWEGDDDDRTYSCRPPQDRDNYFFLCDLSNRSAPGPGSSITIGFHIRIDKRTPGAEGSVTVYGPADPVPGNDRAAIPVEAAPAPFWHWRNPLWRWQHWALAAGVLAFVAPVGRRFVKKRRQGTLR
ncbi:hypothetical protein ACFY30_27145 [Streptomyces sp. NPDC000345]|uniref:hypothetical protein n=1 Tax=Streptomyces sp. NPDC000345 TaxID=3364537 RepID=UPI003692C5CE